MLSLFKKVMAQVKISDKKVLSNEKYPLHEVSFDIQNKKGEWKEQKYEVYNHGDAVSALLYNNESRTVILTKQFRIASYLNGNKGGDLIETPAGLLNEGEAPEAAIIREIKEETGYAIAEVTKVLEVYSSPGAYTEKLYLFVAPYTPQQKVTKGGGLEEEGEEVTVMEIPFDEALGMIDSGEIKDAKTIMLLQYAAMKKLV